MRVPYLLVLSFSLSAVRPYVVDGASYLERVVGDDVSSREARRVSVAAVSLNIPVRVDDAVGSIVLDVTAGRVVTGAGVVFTFDSSSVSDSSSELDSSSEDSDSSFLAAGVVGWAVDDCKKRD